MELFKGLGAEQSPYDLRTFTYAPDKANYKGGTRYAPQDIEDQSKVGICTAISLTQQARKARGVPYSAEFQYLLQKKFIDKNWNEGSSIAASLQVAYKYGLLLQSDWTYTTQADRNLPYAQYIKKLQKITDAQISKLLVKAAKNKILGYQNVAINRDLLANAIDSSEAGLLTRMVVGSEWWTPPIEPLRYPQTIISGHAITNSNYTGGSFRVANTWGADWADGGTAYFMLTANLPTEAWIAHYNSATATLLKQQSQRETWIGKIKDYIQKVINMF
jgi:hypothetical protein